MDHAFHPDVIAILRRRCSQLSLMELREYSVITYEAITDLCFLSEEDLAVGTPVHAALPGAFLDILYGGSANRQGIFVKNNFVISLLIICVGFDAPIEFKEGALSDWLENSQAVATKVLEMFSHQFYVNDYGIINDDDDSVRASHERTLQEAVLAKVDLRFMAMTPMELYYGSHVCFAEWSTDHSKVQANCTLATP